MQKAEALPLRWKRGNEGRLDELRHLPRWHDWIPKPAVPLSKAMPNLLNCAIAKKIAKD